MSESDPEKPVPDVVEQQRDAAEDPEALLDDEPAGLPFDVNEADAVEHIGHNRFSPLSAYT